MLIDTRRALPGSWFEAEVCVIGSGPAGAAAAAELADRGLRVVVLEGGGPGMGRTARDTYRGIPGHGAHDPVDAVRQKRLGGTSIVWGGRCAPLDDIDFTEREWLPGTTWPITHDELRTWYPVAQRHLDAGACVYSAAGSGFPLTPSGVSSETLSWDDLWRWSPPTSFAPRVEAMAKAGRIRLFLHATVTRLERDPVSGAATEAVVVPRPGLEVRVRAKQFVVAAGGLESTRILLASDGYGGTGLGAGIGDEHGQVGTHYMTHPVGEVGRLRLTRAGRELGLGYLPTDDGVYARRMLALSGRAQADHRLGNLKAALWFADPKDPDHGDALLSTFALTYWGMGKLRTGFKAAGTHAQYSRTTGIGRHVRNVTADPLRVARFARGWARPRITGERRLPSFMPLDSGHCRLRFDAEQTPDPANRVTLDRDRDALGQHRLRVDYRVSASDRDAIATSLGLIGKELERTGLAFVDMSDVERVHDMDMTDGTHQMGLLRMSDSPRSGVVDAECRVHGTPNVHIASSAVFPSAGAVGPTLALVALACRTADLIARES
ncbi:MULTISPECIES: FAD-dependent oxidoreductase [Pseudonocardia]|uniref:Fructose dehydrogenase large subunit n=2 Tax=Pseudonocardia TaxID=1847 RepID=A0A1Y2MJV1_PSEAH|nr:MULTISPECIES: FAD-dependent oxidoreductase [Pseudonocardia]OSY35533.1 Fructose dehydrogenase large subunit [Pseudonocardia autotrophica]TDN76342.1 choline dehydrogenase-like flavoprotein [Pseudonocardia autotrophica]BBG00326.1 GMC oxidoreductase [Pseudonocardia autotrophica]GEC27483.1 GMC oxidoreductase [Pseudonocardia saturnea]